MSIPSSMKMSDCVGKYATLDRNIQNGAGQCVAKGSRVRIVGVGRSLHIQTDVCKCCGQSCYIRNVSKSSLTLCEE